MTATPDDGLLGRVRKLLAKAEDESCTPAEAEALTKKAAELMARYGIDRALLGALRPETDKLADRMIDVSSPWAGVKAHLLGGLATALRCQCVQLSGKDPGARLHVFGYASDIERAEILFTSLLVQMGRALARQPVPAVGGSARAWHRSWMLGYCTAVVTRVRAAEEQAAATASSDASAGTGAGVSPAAGAPSAALVLADRAVAVRSHLSRTYPKVRRSHVTFSGSGYGDGYREGQNADIGGGGKITSRPAGALPR